MQTVGRSFADEVFHVKNVLFLCHSVVYEFSLHAFCS